MDMKTTEKLVRLIAKNTCRELWIALDILGKQSNESEGAFWTLTSNLKSTAEKLADITKSFISTLESIEDAVIMDTIAQIAPKEENNDAKGQTSVQ